jgi:hypothetical protein
MTVPADFRTCPKKIFDEARTPTSGICALTVK